MKTNFKSGFTHQNFLKKISSGFTLIELLVVVAIIGILASVVLASLNTARAKGADAAIKADLSNMRAGAELIGGDTSDYTTVCATGTNTRAQYDAALLASGSPTTGALCVPGTSITKGKWAASVPLKSVSGKNWCVDYAGSSKETTGNTLTASAWEC